MLTSNLNELPITDFKIEVSIQLITSIKTQPPKGSKAKPSISKTQTTKRTHFTINKTKTSYLEYLKALLQKHGQDKYRITEQKTYKFKYFPTGKAKASALDVEGLEDWIDMVKNIEEDSLEKITTVIDLADVKKTYQVKKNMDNDEDVEAESDEDEPDSQLSPSEVHMAELRQKLERKYKNDHDGGATYVSPDGFYQLALTPYLLSLWARAIHDGTTTLDEPPRTQPFDPESKRASLLPGARSRSGFSTPQSSGDNVAVLGQVMTSMTNLMQTALAASGKAHHLPSALDTPKTPTRSNPGMLALDHQASSSPPIPHPTDLPRFLAFAEKKLGVANALQFESPLRRKGIGPDILADIRDESLVQVGITEGDVIRLKKGSTLWWQGPDAKRKPIEATENHIHPTPGNDFEPFFYSGITGTSSQDEQVRYEYSFGDGGHCSWPAPPPKRGRTTTYDRSTTFFDNNTGTMIAIPEGYTCPAPYHNSAADDD